jgi:hypothetical protein
MATVVPLAYYPAYAITGADPSLPAFARAWLSLGFWPSGPVWFLWLLIVFDASAAGVHALRCRWMAIRAARSPGLYSRPAAVAHQPLPFAARLLYDLTYVLCCCTISFTFIGLFRRFANKRQPVLDSLHANSYDIYLIHIPFVIWLQFALLAVAAGPLAKGIIVIVGAVTLRWAIVAALRRVPAIARIL